MCKFVLLVPLVTHSSYSIARLASSSLIQYKVPVYDLEDHLRTLEFQSRNWTMAHVRLGEMQTLQALSGIAFSALRVWEKELEDPTSDFFVRETACPQEFLEALMDE